MRLAIVPARGGSRRIPGKNLHPFCGRPLIRYPLEAARQSGLFDLIHVSTDSAEIAAVAEGMGLPVDFLRDPVLAENPVSLYAVMAWVVEQYARRGQTYDEICLLYATAPLIEAADLAGGYEAFAAEDKRRPVLSVAVFPSPVERALAIEEGALRWRFPEHQATHSQDLPTAYYDAAAFMYLTADQLRQGVKGELAEFAPYRLPAEKVVDINNPEDLSLAEALYLGRRARKQHGEKR